MTYLDEVLAGAVGKMMTAAGYAVQHTGGGCMAWERRVEPSGAYLWVCTPGQDLGETTDEEYLVGFYDADGNTLADGEVSNLAAALKWCEAISETKNRLLLERTQGSA